MSTLDAALTEYRIRTVRIGAIASVLVLVALLLYVLVPGGDDVQQRTALTLMWTGLAGALVMTVLPWRRLFERGVGLQIMYAWSVINIVLVSLLVAAGGDSHLEIFFLYLFGTLFATSYPPRGQVLTFLFTESCYLGVMAFQGWPVEVPVLVASMGLLAVFAWMAWFLSHELMRGLQEAADARDEADRRARMLAIVADTARTLNALDSEEVLEGVVEGATRLGFEATNLAVLEPDRETFRAAHPVGLPKEYVERSHPSDSGMPGMVLERGATVVMDDYQAHPRAIPMLAREGFRAVIATPVWVQGEIAAALVGGTREDRKLSTEDVEAFELLAAVAGPALENARRFEEERRTNERLTELDRLKSDFLSNVSHELRTPLTAIKGIGTTLEQLWSQLSEDDRRDLLGRLNANAASLHHIIATLLDFSSVEAGRLPVEWQHVDAVGLARDMIDRLRHMLESHPVEIDAPERLIVRADAVLLDRVLENLVANAVLHTPSGTAVVVAMRQQNDQAIIEVADRGPGIPESELPHIGERFFRGGDPNTRKTRGTGLGLALVQEILRLHRTQLEVVSTVGEGSRFSFRLVAAVREDAAVSAP